MCILSGCDYLENLPGIGLGKAKKFLKSIQKTDLEQVSMTPLCQALSYKAFIENNFPLSS